MVDSSDGDDDKSVASLAPPLTLDAHLPDEVCVEVLRRVNADDLAQLRCVSKHLRRLIYVNRHRLRRHRCVEFSFQRREEEEETEEEEPIGGDTRNIVERLSPLCTTIPATLQGASSIKVRGRGYFSLLLQKEQMHS